MNGLQLLTAYLAPLFVAVLLPWLPVRARLSGYLASGAALLSGLSLLALARGTDLQAGLVLRVAWVPSLGIDLTFLIDGLSVFFGLIVTWVGAAVLFYSAHYLEPKRPDAGRFHSLLLLFLVAMLGTVFANDLILLFVSWELTGLASYFLIGFEHNNDSARAGARRALLVTAMTGLVMMAGLILARQLTGGMEISQWIHATVPGTHSRLLWNVAAALILIGAFGKSAQLPFQFWLPGAMAAPTPVSAYLHSATMVKLGVFLTARLHPMLSETDVWTPLLVGIGFASMLYASVVALLATDLKAMLAYATIAALGTFLAMYGLGPILGLRYDYLQVINHVFYKGSLFMVAGIIDHAAGTRDVRKLGGLWHLSRPLGVITILALAVMAGLPPTSGFLGKEISLKGAVELLAHPGLGGKIIFAVIVTGLVLHVVFVARLYTAVFLGKPSDELRRHWHAPGRGLLAMPFILAGLAWVGGLMPGLLQAMAATLRVPRLHSPVKEELALWHGFTPELAISLGVFAGGFLLYLALRSRMGRGVPEALEWGAAFDRGLDGFIHGAKWLTIRLGSGRPLTYLPLLLLTVLLTVGSWSLVKLSPGLWTAMARVSELGINPERGFVVVIVSASVMGVLFLRGWAAQLISLTICGFLVAFYFVLHRAPDLALTQLLIETITLILVLLLLARFSKSEEAAEAAEKPAPWRQCGNALLALAMGAMMTTLVFTFHQKHGARWLGDFYLNHAVDLGHGHNAVNVILVDFRGFDTLGEITVLVIAMLGGLGLLMRYKRSGQELAEGPTASPGNAEAGDSPQPREDENK